MGGVNINEKSMTFVFFFIEYDVDNMFIQFNGDCDSTQQPCIADLHVQNAEPSDSGLYQCVGTSDIGATRGAFYNVKVISEYQLV